MLLLIILFSNHLDSHLKPYQCKFDKCSNTYFSYIGGLIRHEREVHGMHGHEAESLLCEIEECKRAHKNYGFQSRYSLLEHLRRVHGYSVSEPSKNSDSLLPSDSSSHKDPTNSQRKRKTPNPDYHGPTSATFSGPFQDIE